MRKSKSPRWNAGSIDPLARSETFAELSIGVVEEVFAKEIPQNDDDRRFGVGQESETFPDHEARSHDRRKVEYLQHDLTYSRGLNNAWSVHRRSSQQREKGGSTCRQPRRRIDLSSSANIGEGGRRESDWGQVFGWGSHRNAGEVTCYLALLGVCTCKLLHLILEVTVHRGDTNAEQ